MFFNELDNQSRQRLIDIQQLDEAVRAAEQDLRGRFRGSMAWKPRAGQDYLYRRCGRIEKSLGPRSTVSEAIYDAFTIGKDRADQRAKGLKRGLEGMASVNRALGLGRVPKLVARILRRLEEADVLGKQVCVVGTNAMFAYEAHAGIRFESGLLATGDLDIALDARRRLALASRMIPNGLLGLLQRIDPSFSLLRAGSFRAFNASGLMVDLITPEARNPMAVVPAHQRRLGGHVSLTQPEDLEAVEVPRLEMIVDAPRFAATAIADDGLPVWITAADPRWWAAHKLWLATEPTREPIKRARDRDQAMAVAAMLANRWTHPDLSDTTLASIPIFLREQLRNAVVAAPASDTATTW